MGRIIQNILGAGKFFIFLPKNIFFDMGTAQGFNLFDGKGLPEGLKASIAELRKEYDAKIAEKKDIARKLSRAPR